MITNFLRLLWLVLAIFPAANAWAVYGEMGRVVGEPGRIMEGKKVLAEVPAGTLLWVFSGKAGWYEVKVPGGEQHAWIAAGEMEKVTTQADVDRLTKGYGEYQQFVKLYEKRKFAEAREHLEQWLKLEREVHGPEHPDVADTLYNLGIVYYDLRDYEQALETHRTALAIRRKMLGNGHEETTNSLQNIGLVLEDQEEHDAARKIYLENLALRRKLGGDQRSTAETLNNLGNMARRQGDYRSAQQYLEEALQIFRRLPGEKERERMASVLNNLGNLYDDQVNYPAARLVFEESLAIRRKLLGDDHPDTAAALSGLGILAEHQGDHQTAFKYYSQVLAFNRKFYGNDDPETADALNNLGTFAEARKDYDWAQKFHDEALAIRRKALGEDHFQVAQSLANLGNLAHDQKKYDTARRYYLDALAIDSKKWGAKHPTTASTLNCLGALADDVHDYKAAREYYEQSLAIKRQFHADEHPSVAATLRNLALLCIHEEDYAGAAKFWEQRRRSARQHLQHILPGLSEPEQLRYLESDDAIDWAESLAVGWLKRDDPALVAASAAWLVNGKAVMQEALAARALLARDDADPRRAPLVKELTAVRHQLAALALSAAPSSDVQARAERLAQLTADEERLGRQLTLATGVPATAAQWIDSATVRAALPTSAIYIDLVRMRIYNFETQKKLPAHYLAWVIPAVGQGTIQLLDLGEAEPIDHAVEQARVSLGTVAKQDSLLRTNGEVAATAQVTHDLQAVADFILKPLLPLLGDNKQLILSPDGALWLLPWGALPVGNDRCLLEQCSIRYVLSGRDLVKQEGTNTLATGQPVIFANPDFDLAGQAAKAALKTVLPQTTFAADSTRGIVSKSSLPHVKSLPYTALEGLAVEPLLAKLAGSKPRSYQQDQALEAVAKNLKRPQQLLFATHGFFLPDQDVKPADDKLLASGETRALPALTADGKLVENPLLRCGLLLAGCNAPRTAGLDDGILTGMEIVGMDLRGTELVVLSACETGLGKVRNGEGVAGLRQAFQLAGAAAVVSTLWQVPDRDSALIMQDFFTNLAAGQSKADSLRQAQLKRIAARREKYGAAHPFFWAAWTVTGN